MSALVLIPVSILLGSILFYALRTGVPPVPATRGEIAQVVALLRAAELGPRPVLYELGSGWGSLALGLADAFPEARVVGIELSWLPYLVSRWRARGRPELSFLRQDFLVVDLEAADAVTLYLGIAAARRLAPVFDQKLRPGTPVVALCFGFRDRISLARRPVPGLGNEVTLYRWPAPKQPDPAG